MRCAIALAVALSWAATTVGQEAKPYTRHGVVAIYNKYPQTTAKEALASVIRALEGNHVDYVLAHLTDPAFVDQRVKQYNGRFADLVEESRAKLSSNPATIKQLQRFLKEGEWMEEDGTVTVKLKDVKDQQVFLKRIDKRWVMENRTKPTAEGK